MTFTWLDWVLLSIVLISSLLSLKRGFIKEVLSLAIWICAFIVSLVGYPLVVDYFIDYIPSPSLRQVTAVICLFVATLLIGAIVRFIIGQLIKITGLSSLDRLLGMVFGALRGVLVVVLLIMLLKSVLPITQESWWQASVLIPHFSLLEAYVIELTDQLRQLILPLFAALGEQNTVLLS